jgi:hypothetical protein
MIHFNTKSGEIFKEDRLLTNEDVIKYASETVTLVEGTEDNFSFLSIKRMLNIYPSLMQFTDWTESFMEKAKHIQSRIGVLYDANHAWKPHEIRSLTLQKTTRMNWMEMSLREHFDEERNPIFMSWEDEPSFDCHTSSGLSGVSDDGDQSLSYTPLHQIFYMPIKILNDEGIKDFNYAAEGRTQLDYSKRDRTVYTAKDHSINLIDMLITLMMDINLDPEDELEATLDMLRERNDGSLNQDDPEVDV